MSTQKFGSDYQACAHSFAYAGKSETGENYGNRMFFEGDTIYSYGYHFIIAKKIRDKSGNVDFILFNSGSASNTTNKQQHAVRRALNGKIITCHSDLKYFKPLDEIEKKEAEMLDNLKLYSRARAEHTQREYLGNIYTELADIKFLSEQYRIKSKLSARIKEYLKADDSTILELLGVSEVRRSRARKLKATKIRKAQDKQRQADILKEQTRLKEWKQGEHKRIYLNHIKEDYLRMSADGLNVETSQGVNITIVEAKRLLNLIERKKIIGATIDEKFTVTAFNGFLKVGCHNIGIDEINKIKEVLTTV